MAIKINYSETRGPNVDDFLGPKPTPSCFLPICLYSFMVNRPFLYDYIPWVVSRCEQPKIIIGDFMERHNIMTFESISEVEAIAKAEKRGQRIAKDIESLLNVHGINGEAKLQSCRTIIETPECQAIKNIIRNFSSSNVDFDKDINQQIEMMLLNTKRLSLINVHNLNASEMTHLLEYMIEEIAFFICLYNQGYTTEIYPGRDMKILQKMAASRYRSFPYDFSERTHISISVLLESGSAYACLDNNGEGD